MTLQFQAPFDPDLETEFESFPAVHAVFGLFPGGHALPYLSQTHDLRRRLRRLLARPQERTRLLNLRAITRRIEYQPVGSSFEAQWLLYKLNSAYDPGGSRRMRLKPPALVKVKLRNRFPRCYPSSRLSPDGSLYFGPFPSRTAAERFTGEFLDLFKIRRCVPNLNPDPSHPGCIYSQMKMCMAPCFKGCTDVEYADEVRRVIAFLESSGETLESDLRTRRDETSANLDFEQAARLHRELEKAKAVAKFRPPLVRNVASLHAIIVVRGAGEKTVAFFRVMGGELRGPASLSLAENVSLPVSLDREIQNLLASLAGPAQPASSEAPFSPPEAEGASGNARLPPWQHLSLLARWYYSSFRTGELILLPESQHVPHSRLIKVCRKIVEGGA